MSGENLIINLVVIQTAFEVAILSLEEARTPRAPYILTLNVYQ